MGSKEYNEYLALIKRLNDAKAEKEAYKNIYTQLAVNFGLQDNDVQRLIRTFRFSLATLGL